MYIKVTVAPNSKKEKFIQESEDHFLAQVKEKAERNQANKRVCELVAAFYQVPLGKVKIVTGHHSHGKMLSVDL